MAKEGYEQDRRKKWLGGNHTEGCKNMSAIGTSTLNELIIESHRLTKQSLWIHQDDVMGCYDRIIRTHAILNSRKFGIHDNTWTSETKWTTTPKR